MMRRAALLAVGVLVLGGCGGSGESEEDAARADSVAAAQAAADERRVAEQRWRDRFSAWSVGALGDALAVSGTFSDDATLTLLLDGDPTATAELDAKLGALKACSDNVEALGEAPARLQRARAAALNACAHLEAGAGLFDGGLIAAQSGLGPELLESAADELTRGTELVGQATERLDAPAPSAETTPTTTTEEGSDDAGQIRAHLEDAGFSVAEGDIGTGQPPATAALEVELAGGASVTVYVYASASDAAKAAKPFASVERDFPDQFELRQVGPHLYVGTVEEPAKLPVAAFNKVVKAGGGK